MRPRHDVSRVSLALLSPVFRYSYSRDAYILRGIGGKRGPVLREKRFSRDESDRLEPTARTKTP